MSGNGSDSDCTLAGKVAAATAVAMAKQKSDGDTTHVCIQDSAIRHICAELATIKAKLDDIDQRLAAGGTKMALLDERSQNIGRIAWGVGATVGLGLITLLGSAVVWVIAKAGGHP